MWQLLKVAKVNDELLPVICGRFLYKLQCYYIIKYIKIIFNLITQHLDQKNMKISNRKGKCLSASLSFLVK